MYKYHNVIIYGLVGYVLGVSGDAVIKKITANKYEKHYNRIYYKKTFYGFFSLVGFCSGAYFGYNTIKA
tara:strand:+ start:875 stop:1081 length:207 start_codon:yes stop_codon:yes gene_type:complete